MRKRLKFCFLPILLAVVFSGLASEAYSAKYFYGYADSKKEACVSAMTKFVVEIGESRGLSISELVKAIREGYVLYDDRCDCTFTKDTREWKCTVTKK